MPSSDAALSTVEARYEQSHWNYPYKSWAAGEGVALPVVVRKVSAGNTHTLLLSEAGEVWSFGNGERYDYTTRRDS